MSIPDADHRWRCTHCGNLTRFDVVRRSRVREFWHVDLSGAPAIDETEVLEEVVEEIRCRWCNSTDAIDIVERPAPGEATNDPHEVGGP